MSRPRNLTDEALLDQAIPVFWRQGYAGASVRDLTAATGMSAASLYHRYGDKDGLFVAVLDRYADRGLTSRLARLSAEHDPLAAIATFFHEMRDLSAHDPERLGCLLVNTVLDGGPLTPAARAQARARLAESETFFRISLERAQTNGTLPTSFDPVAQAELLLATLLAMRVLARLDPDPDRLDRLVADALDRIQPQRTSSR